jgi:hypothetical protein
MCKGILASCVLQVDLNDVLKSTLLAYQYALETPTLLKGLESRQALLDFVDLVSQSHPLPQCVRPSKLYLSLRLVSSHSTAVFCSNVAG